MWRLCKLGYTHEPRLVVVVVALTLLAAVPDALFALWLSCSADALAAGDRTVVFAVVGGDGRVGDPQLAAPGRRRPADPAVPRPGDHRAGDPRRHAAGLGRRAGAAGAHATTSTGSPCCATRCSCWTTCTCRCSAPSAGSSGSAVTLALLATIHPAADPAGRLRDPAPCSARPGGRRSSGRWRSASPQHSRLAEHLFATATSAAAGKEVRVTGIGPDLARRRRTEWDRWFAPVAPRPVDHGRLPRGRLGDLRCWATSAPWSSSPSACRRRSDRVLLILAAGARLSSYVGAHHGRDRLPPRRLAGRFPAAGLAGELRRRAGGRRRRRRPGPAPATASGWITVSFAYPGTDRLALEDVTLTLPPGTVVAVVGENGAGKSTLVKLLARMYEPSGRADLGRRARRWRGCRPRTGGERIAGAFQDFFRFEFSAQHSVGLGDLPRLDDEPAVHGGGGRAGRDRRRSTGCRTAWAASSAPPGRTGRS